MRRLFLMFDKTKARLYGDELYGKIIDLKDTIFMIRNPLPAKKVYFEYRFNGQVYQDMQEVGNILPIHNQVLVIGNYIRIKVCESSPETAYICEFDDPKYKL